MSQEPVPASVTERAPSPHDLSALQGADPAIVALRAEIDMIARSPARAVLIQGETGTGKELVARALHELGPRRTGELVAVNCSAVPESLLEVEFFGYEPGAFTDARKAKAGLVEVARGGTLFFDEVAELAPALQAKLLRVLEDGVVRRLGGTRDVPLDARFVAASNVDLRLAVRSGAFRRDLYYRLGVVTLRVPPLRERAGDVPLLADLFLRRFAVRYDKALAGFEPAAVERLVRHPWPGNVRELRNVIERVALLHDGRAVRAEWLVLDLEPDELRPQPPVPVRLARAAPEPDRAASPRDEVRAAERRALVRAVEEAQGNLSEAGRRLGITRETVRARLRRHRLRLDVRVVPEAGG